MHRDQKTMKNEALTKLSFGAHNAMWHGGRSVCGVDGLQKELSNLGNEARKAPLCEAT
jgi:hypothetical protein